MKDLNGQGPGSVVRHLLSTDRAHNILCMKTDQRSLRTKERKKEERKAEREEERKAGRQAGHQTIIQAYK